MSENLFENFQFDEILALGSDQEWLTLRSKDNTLFGAKDAFKVLRNARPVSLELKMKGTVPIAFTTVNQRFLEKGPFFSNLPSHGGHDGLNRYANSAGFSFAPMLPRAPPQKAAAVVLCLQRGVQTRLFAICLRALKGCTTVKPTLGLPFALLGLCGRMRTEMTTRPRVL